MKYLLTLVAVALFTVATTATASAQAAASKPAAAAPTKAMAPAAATPAAPKPVAQKSAGSKYTAAQIKEAQTGLQKQKFYTGKINGVWNASTVKAYKAWEKANNKQATPVIALTAHAIKEEIDKCLAAGCDSHLSKPVKKSTLIDTLQSITA